MQVKRYSRRFPAAGTLFNRRHVVANEDHSVFAQFGLPLGFAFTTRSAGGAFGDIP
jgi:hypothetical protein